MPYFQAHRAVLEEAVAASARWTYWSAAPKAPSGKIYGQSANADAEAAFSAQLGTTFDLDHPQGGGRLGREESPWGFPLGVTDPAATDEPIAEPAAAGAGWAAAGIEVRAGVCLEIVSVSTSRASPFANAVQHTAFADRLPSEMRWNA